MRVSTKGRNALRVLLELAKIKDERFVPLKEIALKHGISKNYLEQIMPLLHKARLVKTTRGFQGGYRLAKPPEEYSLGDILRVTEGNIAPVVCLDNGLAVECNRMDKCPTIEIWQGLNKVMLDYIDNISLKDILEKERSVLIDEKDEESAAEQAL
ncbi:MAG: Rrf2 family transcriptional regulator [Deferribacteraceae bacterium]|jgi:Rrf2 family protein|nr:Rrf2 family transcriptional regulator [Deferribacteraceae bacterium]